MIAALEHNSADLVVVSHCYLFSDSRLGIVEATPNLDSENITPASEGEHLWHYKSFVAHYLGSVRLSR